MGLAFIACRRGAEGGSHHGLGLSALRYIRIAKRGSGGGMKLAELWNSGFWCCCLWAAAMTVAAVTGALYPPAHDDLDRCSAGTGCPVTSQEVLDIPLLDRNFLCSRYFTESRWSLSVDTPQALWSPAAVALHF